MKLLIHYSEQKGWFLAYAYLKTRKFTSAIMALIVKQFIIWFIAKTQSCTAYKKLLS